VANLKEIRRRIGSVKNTQQVTKAMKMVAAAKLRRAQAAAENSREYSEKLTEILKSLSGAPGAEHQPFLQPGADVSAHAIIIGSDRGLCGGYNASIVKLSEQWLASDDGQGAKLTTVGRRPTDHFKRHSDAVDESHLDVGSAANVELARKLAADVSRRFVQGEAGTVYVIYTKFRSAISQEPVVIQLLPLTTEDGDDTDAEIAPDYLFEPNPGFILGSLLPRYVETKIYHAMLEAIASEHGSRMTAMDSATRNAGEMIDKLTLEMNRARQASITTELMEIVSGAEALKG
jgi:F-type H+-transporting ATPase subunit gamma